MRRLALAALSAMLVSTSAFAERIKVGSPAPEFKDLDTADGKKVSLGDFKKDVLIVAITCNHCPVAVAYEDRLVDFVKKHGEKADFVAINVNNMDSDKLPAMKLRAEEKGFNFPYAYDPSQKIGKDLGATVTPEFFVFDKDRKLVYAGGFDDNWQDAEKAKVNYLESAVSAVLEGKQAPKSNKAKGCGVKYDK